jgi:hypothetical protein
MADAPMSHEELAAMLAEDERLAVSFRDSTLAEEQAVAIDYYEAKPFGDEEDGLSQVVTPEVAEVCDYMTISVARTMASGDRVVEFESAEQDMDDAADEATAAVEYCFMKEQPGYRILVDWIQSGMIEKIGVAKTCVETCTKTRKHRATVDEMQLAMLHSQKANIVKADDNGDGTFLIEVHEEYEETKYLDYPIPSEEFLFASRTRHEDEANYIAHRCLKSESDLIEMGFDRDTIEGLTETTSTASMTDSRAVSRWDDETITQTPGLKQYWLREEYKRVDMDGDGYAELIQVFRVENTILGVEEVDENPFVVWCPFPRAHRMVGNSLADKVMDLQRIKSVVLRQQLNGLYLTNNPRMYVPQDCMTEDTIDDLLTVRPGGIVRGKGATKPEPLYEAFEMDKGMKMLEYITGERESRTGITRLNQGLDADALNKTATGTALMQAQGQQMEEYVARNFAEALGRLFAKKLRLMVSVGKPFPIKVEGQAKMVDPSKWPEGLSANVRVGLGSGRKDQRLQYRDMILDVQKEAMPLGLTTKKHIYNNISDGARDMGFNPADLFVDPDSQEGQQIAQGLAQQAQQQPDPEMQKVQADMAAKQQEMALKQQGQQADAQLKAVAAQAKIDAEHGKTAAQMQAEREKADAEAQLEIRRQNMDFELSQRQMAVDEHVAHTRAHLDHQAKVAKARQGGDLSK